jgi:hypothetical protein
MTKRLALAGFARTEPPNLQPIIDDRIGAGIL